MTIDADDFRVEPGRKLRLGKWPTRARPFYSSRRDYERTLATHVARMSALQARLYAADRHALLLIFQAMDAAGKDGVIKHVMSGVNP